MEYILILSISYVVIAMITSPLTSNKNIQFSEDLKLEFPYRAY